MIHMQEPTSPDTWNSADSLALIHSMINKAKNQFSENGHLYLLWGWVVFICSLGHYLMMAFTTIKKGHYVWALTWVAVVYMIYYLVKNRSRKRVSTYTDEILGMVWITFLITSSIIVVLLLRTQGDTFYKTINLFYLALYGVPVFLSGFILKFNPLKIGGVLCWILAIVTSFVPPREHLLLIALAMVVAWIIPGYLLKKKYQHEIGADV